MLWDPKWQAKVTPRAEELEPWRLHYLAAAEYLEVYGWDTWRLGVPGSPRCLLGALLSAKPSGEKADCMPLERYLGVNYHGLVPWNDAPGRTKEQVIFALRDCAMNGE